MSIPFNLGGRVGYSSKTKLSDFFILGFNSLQLFRLLLKYSLAHLSITFCCSTDMMVRSYPIELRVGYGCRLKPVGSALTQHVMTYRFPFLRIGTRSHRACGIRQPPSLPDKQSNPASARVILSNGLCTSATSKMISWEMTPRREHQTFPLAEIRNLISILNLIGHSSLRLVGRDCRNARA